MNIKFILACVGFMYACYSLYKHMILGKKASITDLCISFVAFGLVWLWILNK